MMALKDLLTLRLHSGIPVVEIDGEWSANLAEALVNMLASLQKAGHFDIVLNVQRAALGGMSGLRSLVAEARVFRSHHGHLDIVGTVEQVEELSASGLAGLVRLAHSEEMALSRIKRVPVLASGSRFTARTLD